MSQYKILVSKDNGTMIFPVYEASNPRPCPPDAEWVYLTPDSVPYKGLVANQDVSHIDLDKTHWDFSTQTWIEVASTSLPTLENAKRNRNEILKNTDKVFATISDPDEIAAWVKFREQLRTMFDDLPDDFDYNMLVFPRSPVDIKELKEEAAAGDTEAAAIIKREGL
jgi:hypothetical protein